MPNTGIRKVWLIRLLWEQKIASSNLASPTNINMFMFKAHKEIIWHLTCIKCKGWFTFATMEDKYCADRTTWHCPHCGTKGRIDNK